MRDYRKIAEDFALHLKAKYGERIERVILFGSVARGDYREDSDVDLIVVGRGDRLALQGELAADSVRLLLETGVLVTPMAFTQEEMGRVDRTLFGRTVASEGVVLA
ncbi:MAG TPA: nucleotidyltransferase domain-containing protein [Thermoplasmata archaeon]